MPRPVSVALPVPLYGTYTYLVPERAAGRVAPGSRVVVQVRGRRVVGVVTRTDPPLDPGRTYRDIVEAPDESPSLTPALLATAQWIATHYAAPIGLVLRAALPALLTGPGKPAPAPRTRRVASLHALLPTLVERDAAFRRSPRQRAAFELLESLGGRVPVEHLQKQLGVSQAVLGALVRRGFVRLEREAHSDDVERLSVTVDTPVRVEAGDGELGHDGVCRLVGPLRSLRRHAATVPWSDR